MKPSAECKLANNVMTDFYWRQRVETENKELIDSYAGPKAYQIKDRIFLSSN